MCNQPARPHPGHPHPARFSYMPEVCHDHVRRPAPPIRQLFDSVIGRRLFREKPQSVTKTEATH